MFVLKNEGRRGKKLGIWVLEIRHGRATTGTGRAKLLELWLWSGMVRHGRATAGTGRANFLAFSGSNLFFSFS